MFSLSRGLCDGEYKSEKLSKKWGDGRDGGVCARVPRIN